MLFSARSRRRHPLTQSIGKWLSATEVAAPKRITKVFDIVASQTEVAVGCVQWFAPWRRYNFFPVEGSCYDAQCLRDLAGFCDNLMAERKAKK